METTHRGISIGAWLMLIAAAVGVPFAVVAYAILRYFGGPILPLEAPIAGLMEHPLWLVLLAVSGLVTLLASLLFLIGLIIYVVVPSLSPETARIDYASYWTALASFILAAAVGVLLQLLFSLAAATLSPTGELLAADGRLSPLQLLTTIVNTEVGLLLVLWIRIVRPGVISWRDMGITTERLGERLSIGFLAGIVVFVVASIIEFILASLGIQQTQLAIFEPLKSAPLAQFVALLLAGAGLAGFVEESFFRGYVFKAVLARKGAALAYLFSALLFSAAHLDLRAALPIFVTGLILAYVYRSTNSVIPAMVAHGLNNAVAFVVLYLGLV